MRKKGTKHTNNTVKEIKREGWGKISKNNSVKEILGKGFKRKLNSVWQRKPWLFVENTCKEQLLLS